MRAKAPIMVFQALVYLLESNFSLLLYSPALLGPGIGNGRAAHLPGFHPYSTAPTGRASIDSQITGRCRYGIFGEHPHKPEQAP